MMTAQKENHLTIEETENTKIDFPNKLVLAYKKLDSVDAFKHLNDKIKELENLQLSALKAIEMKVVKFETNDRMLINKSLNRLYSVKNTNFSNLADFVLKNDITLLEANQFISAKLQEFYTNFYDVVTSYKYKCLGEKWVTVPVSASDNISNQLQNKFIQITVDGSKIKFPIQIDDLKGLEFHTNIDLLNNDLVVNNPKTTKRIKKIVLLRI